MLCSFEHMEDVGSKKKDINYMKTREFPTSMEGLTTHNGRSAAKLGIYSMKLGSL